MTYTEHDALPPHEPAKWDKKGHALDPAPGLVRWVHDGPPPPIGAEIVVTINGCGPAVVTGYFTQDGWLGVRCKLHAPPPWHVKQNNGDPNGCVFGPEFRLA